MKKDSSLSSNVAVEIRVNKSSISLVYEKTKQKPNPKIDVSVERIVRSLFVGDLLRGAGVVDLVVIPEDKLPELKEEFEKVVKTLRERFNSFKVAVKEKTHKKQGR